mmetsp:Transcript_37826/g.92770  ORF Transcript_37826/g.92770 Transcript_37826/m.92770 type:complete len:100 (-) Transcript_37826:1427-1726(-)
MTASSEAVPLDGEQGAVSASVCHCDFNVFKRAKHSARAVPPSRAAVATARGGRRRAGRCGGSACDWWQRAWQQRGRREAALRRRVDRERENEYPTPSAK